MYTSNWIALNAFFGIFSFSLFAHVTDGGFAHCFSESALEEMAQDPNQKDAVIDGINVEVFVQGHENEKNVRYGAFVSAGKFANTEKAEGSRQYREAYADGEIYNQDLRVNWNMAGPGGKKPKVFIEKTPAKEHFQFISMDSAQIFHLEISKVPRERTIVIPGTNKLFSGIYDREAWLDAVPKNVKASDKKLEREKLLCQVLGSKSNSLNQKESK